MELSDFSANYFELFSLPTQYEVDREKLATQYRELQQQFHPDRFASATDQDRRLALQMASRINEAERVLRDPIARARYLLELQGIELGSDSETVRDPEFLMEQMELREQLEAAESAADPEDALDQFATAMKQQIENHGQQFSQQWEKVPEQAKQTMQQMQFFARLRQQAESALDQLF